MPTAKGVNPGVSSYETHNFCTHCGEWRAEKPYRCVKCGMRCRTRARYVKGGTLAKNLQRMQQKSIAN